MGSSTSPIADRDRETPLTLVRVLGPGEAFLLADVEADVFDHQLRAELVREFLEDPRHHLAVALDGDRVVGMASAVHYVHPDKPAELWINEVGVAETARGRGIGSRLVGALLDHGRSMGCREAWVLTEPDNEAARRLYSSRGGTEEEAVLFSFRLEAPSGS